MIVSPSDAGETPEAAVHRSGFGLFERVFKTPGPAARGAALATGAVVLWATWPALAAASAPAPPFLVFGMAAAVGFVLSLATAALRGRARSFSRTPPKALLTVTCGLLAHNILFLHAVPRIGASEANVLAYLWPIMAAALIARLRAERIRPAQWLGMATAFIGVAVAIGPGFERGADVIGLGLAAASGLAFAVMSAVRSQAEAGNDAVGPSMGVIAVVALLGHMLFEEPATLGVTQMLVIAGIGVAPVTLANALWDKATREGRAAVISGIAYTTPIAALGVLALVGIATVTAPLMLGAGLVVMGAMFASGVVKTG